MAYRKKMKKQRSRKLFTKTAMRTNGKNLNPRPKRGGTRL